MKRAAGTLVASVEASEASVRTVFSIPAFRGIWTANVLASLATGTGRFTFIWLVGDLTEWNPAIAILGLAVGLPALALSPIAGAFADRLPPRTLGIALMSVSSLVFAVTAVLAATPLMTVPVAVVCGLASAVPTASSMPLFQSVVPAVVPPRCLMRAVALQNMGMNGATIVGSVIAGAVIGVWGPAGGFWMLAGTSALALAQLARTDLPPSGPGAGTSRRGAVRQAVRLAFFNEPLRSLLLLSFSMGMCVAGTLLLLPEISRDVLDVGSVAAGALMSVIAVGLMTGAGLIARRGTLRRPGQALVILAIPAIGAGPLLLGISRHYVTTAAVGFLWGVAGGSASAVLRTLIQEHTPAATMGRMMGLSALAHHGAFPIASLVMLVLVRATSVPTSVAIIGVVGIAIATLQAVRPHIRTLTTRQQ